MRKFILYLLLFFVTLSVLAQKEDRNWVFGNGCGIDFSNLNNIQTFKPESYNFEASASISDSVGNLLLYLGLKTQGSKIEIRNGNHEVLIDGSDINIGSSIAHGAFFLPRDQYTYYLFYSSPFYRCSGNYCIKISYSIIDISYDNFRGKFVESNIPVNMSNYSISEGITAVKHANGKDWWIIARQVNESICTNRFVKLLVADNSIEIMYQDIGTQICNARAYLGEVSASKKGNLISYIKYPEGVIEVFNFDRCTGRLSNHRLLDQSTNIHPYSAEFSYDERFLYVNKGATSFNIQSRLSQYDLHNNGNKKLVWKDDTVQISDFMLGQLEMAPNGKIYVAYCENSSLISTNVPNQYNQYLCVINQPDSLGTACDFQPFSFYLGDSSYASLALPNMPNYNLGPLSIYKADAGSNKVICLSQQEKGAYLGDSAISGVEYQWYPTLGMDSPNIAMPYIVPDSSLWYYVTITDTSIKNACQSRTDSVWVEFQGMLDASFTYIINDSLVNFESQSRLKLTDHTWYFGDGNIGQNPTTQHIYNYSEDSITVMHIVSSRCDSDTAFAKILIEAPIDSSDTVGVMNIFIDKLNYRLLPNLQDGNSSAILKLGEEERGTIEIYNMTGNLVHFQEVQTGDNNIPISVTSFSSGVYLYKVRVNKELKRTDKLVVIKK